MRARRTGRFLLLAAACCAVTVGGNAWALTDEEIFRDFGFSLIRPGARALGMGGAFAAVGGDASAIQTNPAALHYASRPGLMLEFRSIEQDPRRFSSDLGSLEVDPVTGERDLPFLGLTSESETETVEEPTFAAYTHSTLVGKPGRRLTAAVSRHLLVSGDRSLGSGDGLTGARFSFESFPNTVRGGQVEAYAVDTQVSGVSSIEIVQWSAGVSFEASRDFSVGLTLTHAGLDVELDTLTRVVDPLELFLDPSHPRLPAEPASDLFRTTVDGSDSDLTYTVGIHWHPDSIFPSGESPWRLGAVFRKGAEFDVEESTLLNDLPEETFDNRLVIPDRIAIGLSYRVKPYWTFAAEYERVEYSDMLDRFRSGVNFLTSGRVAGGAFDIDEAVPVEFTVDDGNVPRLGVEYDRGLAGGRRIMLRAGLYRMPDGRIRMVRFNSEDPDVNETYLDAFRGGEEENHFTFGAGYSFGRASIDVAGDFSDEGTQVVGSFGFRLGQH